MDNIPDSSYTLGSIAQQKAVVLQQIRKQKDIMLTLTKDTLVSVTPAIGKAGSLMRAFHTGIAIFDGVRLGVKIIRRFRKYF